MGGFRGRGGGRGSGPHPHWKITNSHKFPKIRVHCTDPLQEVITPLGSNCFSKVVGTALCEIRWRLNNTLSIPPPPRMEFPWSTHDIVAISLLYIGLIREFMCFTVFFAVNVGQKVSMTRKCHSHTLQTNPRHHEERTQKNISHLTSRWQLK